MTLDDPAVLIRKAAWLEQIHDLHRVTRRVAMACVVLGFALLIWVRVQGLPHPVLWTAGALLVVGWSAYIYVLVQKNRYIRSHPFDPDA